VVLSTHQTEDVAAVCSSVVVVNRGRVLFTGGVDELARQATGRVWVDTGRDPRALAAWRLGADRYHHIGEPPAGAQLVEPSVEDAYLLLVGPQSEASDGELRKREPA
jgi:ABC-2 type transport system ATP-binding protein